MQELADKTLLVTGGTGSFGNALVQRVMDMNFREIRIFSRDELKQDLMRQRYQNPKLKFYLGDVRDRASVDTAMANVDLVFHAAALKQVPSCEFFPMQAVLTNVVGSNNVVSSAVAHGVDSVVCLSTDKAAYPINAMGISKAMMEKVAMAAARAGVSGETTVSCVRYGNVMASRGSVIPLFIRQIKAGEPLTVTDPQMTRFMLPLSAAVELVLFAFTNARPGDLFVRKAPACTVGDLAEATKRLFKANNEIRIIGMRHGEKLYETLLTAEEMTRATDMGDYFRVQLDDRDLNYSVYYTEGDLDEAGQADYHSHNTDRLDVDQVERLLLTLDEVQAEL